MNPKEVSYSHPQLPLCDTPICLQIRPLAGIETQKYRFFGKMQVLLKKKLCAGTLISGNYALYTAS